MIELLTFRVGNSMRVKIGDTWYDSNDQPICIQISEIEHGHISGMDRGVASQCKYASFPDSSGMSPDQMRDWMEG